MYNNQFDALEYYNTIAEHNSLAMDNRFKVCFCSGIDGAEGVMAQFQNTANFIMIDDITSGATRETPDGFYEKNTYTVFVFARYKVFDMASYNESMRLCRRIFHQLVSRIIHDQDNGTDGLGDIKMDNILSTEFGRDSFTGMTGLMFHIDNDEPTDLVYDESEWDG